MLKSAPPDETGLERAARLRQAFLVGNEVYLIGSLERGVTVYSQQVRAHNLIWALRALDKEKGTRVERVAVMGGGIAGLTAAACTLSLYPSSEVTIFERTWDLCALQQGSDSRWLHPRIYYWPAPGSRAPSASLPLLNWQEGRASDVAHQILEGFGQFIQLHEERFYLIIGVSHLKISESDRRVEWLGSKGIREGSFFRSGPATGGTATFDRIILAVGFGMETHTPEHPTPSYWRNEDYGQPLLDGRRHTYVVSGYGDGAIVDLCRLTIERFRQDRILYDIFGGEIEAAEQGLLDLCQTAGTTNIYDRLVDLEKSLLADAVKALQHRIRKDTQIILHLAGKGNLNHAVQDVFGNSSSFFNRLLLYLLFRCGAFTPSFDSLESLLGSLGEEPEGVLCRYGPNSMSHVRSIFVISSGVDAALDSIQDRQEQQVRREWVPGCFGERSDDVQ